MKRMFKYLLSLFVGFILLSGCGSGDEGVKVSGNIESTGSGDYILVNELVKGGFQTVDTVDVPDNGDFTFFLQVEQPSYYRINFFNRLTTDLILDGTEEEVTITRDVNTEDQFNVEGSTHTKYLKQMNGIVTDYQQDAQEINQMAIQARMDDNIAEYNKLKGNYIQLLTESKEGLKDFIYSISPSLAAYHGLQLIGVEGNLPFFDSVAVKFEEKLPDHIVTQMITEQIDRTKTLAIGAEAPEIEMPTPAGDMFKLSSLRGKYVLIDFWAGWCRPCRQENPNVLRMYEKYSGENFEILGVSLDRTKDAWVKAIEQDGLPWVHVSDIKYFNSEAAADYQISAIPATYLIDPDGKIIAKNLRGPSLEAKLKEIFG